MAKHSKWDNIKRVKEVKDAKRSKIFSKISRLIMVAAKQGGGDPDSNPNLRLAVEKAREARMPNENIDKAIRKGTGEGSEGSNFSEAVYEGFGPNGEAFYIRALTDNRNRTVSEVRNVFNKFAGSLGGAGSTSYIFLPDPTKPSYTVELSDLRYADKLTNLIDELEENDDIQEVYFNFVLPPQL